jgi:hypothetical protein
VKQPPLPPQKQQAKAVPNHYQPLRSSMRVSRVEVKRFNLQNEIWFHGIVSREMAEAVLRYPGEFLVRESNSMPGHLILSCFNGEHQHIHLTDREGKIKTSNREFSSVNEFIDYHFRNNAPIIAPKDCRMFLQQPIISDASPR